jgi:hypothetical protein
MSKLISLLPEDIRVIALQRQREANRQDWRKDTDQLIFAFNWVSTIEDYDLWQDVENGNYTPFRKFHAKKQPENNGWIPKSERWPETEDEVLVIDSFGKISTASYSGGIWYDYIDDYHSCSDIITHWQPLPPPPAKS